MKILNTSWAGHGEHGVLEVYMDIEEGKLLLSLSERSYSDWGGSSQLTSERTGSKKYDVNKKELSEKVLYDCVIDLVEKECGITDYKIKEQDIIC